MIWELLTNVNNLHQITSLCMFESDFRCLFVIIATILMISHYYSILKHGNFTTDDIGSARLQTYALKLGNKSQRLEYIADKIVKLKLK